MASKIKVTQVDRTDKAIPFRDLAEGELYDSASRWGLCVKLTESSFLSLTEDTLISSCSDLWFCHPVVAHIRWKRA